MRIGLKRNALTGARPLPSTQLAWNAWEGLMAKRHWLEGLVANTCAERINVPGYGRGELRKRGWFGLERQRWARLFRLSDAELDFFELHAGRHRAFGHRLARGREVRAQTAHGEAVVAACERNLYVWEHYLNGIAAAGDAHEHRK